MSPTSLTCSTVMMAALLMAPASAEDLAPTTFATHLEVVKLTDTSQRPAVEAGELTFWRDLLPPVVIHWAQSTAETWLTQHPQGFPSVSPVTDAVPMVEADPLLFATRIQQFDGVRR